MCNLKSCILFVVSFVVCLVSFVSAQTVSRGEGCEGFGADCFVTDGNVNIAGTDEFQEQNLIDVIKGAVNRVLGILALIALIVLLVGGFRMVTAAGNEDQYSSGFSYVKNAAIGLAIIGVARFIISLLFWLFNLLGTESEGVSGGTTS